VCFVSTPRARKRPVPLHCNQFLQCEVLKKFHKQQNSQVDCDSFGSVVCDSAASGAACCQTVSEIFRCPTQTGANNNRSTFSDS
jgi:hypothetical protein